MRLFFAAFPSEETRRGLEEQLPAIEHCVRVPMANYHMTLAFLGETDGAKVPHLLEIGAAQTAAMHAVKFTRLEFWPGARVLVATFAEVPAGLRQLAVSISASLLGLDIRVPSRDWVPHLTLLKKVTQAPLVQDIYPVVWEISSFSLVQSSTDGTRSAYTVLATWPLLYKT